MTKSERCPPWKKSDIALTIVVTIIVAAVLWLFGVLWESRRRAAATAAVERLGGNIEFLDYNDPFYLGLPRTTCTIDLHGRPIDDDDLNALADEFRGTGVDHYSLDIGATDVTEAGWRAFMKRFSSVRVLSGGRP